MALHLNLYHEVQKQSRARRRDPVKIAILGALVVAIGLVVYYLHSMREARNVTAELAAKQAEWTRLEAEKEQAEIKQAEAKHAIELSREFVKQIEGRFYWAPVLERLLRAVPPEVQLTRFEGRIDPAGGGRVVIAVDGVGAGLQPRTVAEELRLALGEKLGSGYLNVASEFVSLEDGAATVELDGVKARTAVFAISVTMNLAPPPAAPAAKPRRERKKASNE